MRLTIPIAIVVLAAALLAGCGSSSDDSSSGGSSTSGESTSEQTGESAAPAGAKAQSCDSGAETIRATGVSCDEARAVVLGWHSTPTCATRKGTSRSACTVSSYRCLVTSTARGLAVSCASPGRSVAFIARPG